MRCFPYYIGVLLLCFLFTKSEPVFCQNTKQEFSIKIQVQDSAGQPINFAYVRITPKGSKLILRYQNLGDASVSKISMKINTTDTLLITVNASEYMPVTKMYIISSNGQHDSGLLIYTLPYLETTLPDAIVTAPPVWVRGDTTFYKVDAFKTGDERKLKDIIAKLPGFEFDQNGRLLFHKQAISKIMIGGEEIFSDKLELLLSSFPVHVLEQIQAIENQSNNRLLKGLHNDKLIFVNLGLKKDKLKTAFGDGEVGLGTGGRYSLSPVLFGLYGKIKGGLIGNYNSLGTGFDWKLEAENKMETNRDAEFWMMQGIGLYTINNLESRRYIQNRLFDNRLQLNIPLHKKVSAVAELATVNDRQRQQTAMQSTFLNGTSFITRTDRNYFENRPHLHNHALKIEWKIDSTRSLISGVNFYGNFQQQSQNRLIITEGLERDSTRENVNQQLIGVGAFFDYTKRLNRSKAFFIKGNYYKQDFPQNGSGFSMAYPAIFNIANGLNQLNHQIGLQRQVGNLQVSSLTRPRKTLFTHHLDMQWERSITSNSMVFKDRNVLNNSIFFDELSNSGEFQMYRITAGTSTSINLKDIELSIKGDAGFQTNQMMHYFDKEQHNNHSPILESEIRARKELISGKESVAFTIAHQQTPRMLWQTANYFRPNQLVQFRRFAGIEIPISETQITGGYRFQQGRSSNSILLIYTRHWNGEAYSSELFQFAQILVDSFNRIPFDVLSINASSNLHWLQAGTSIHLDGGYNRMGRQYIVGKDIVLGRYDMYYAGATINKQFQKKLFLNWKSHYSANYNKLPASFGTAFSPWVHNFRTHLTPRVVVKKYFSISMVADYYLNNIYTSNKASFFLLDTELALNVPNKPLSFRLRFENITNQPFFYQVNQSPLNQSFYTVPLVPRNLIFFVRYEL